MPEKKNKEEEKLLRKGRIMHKFSAFFFGLKDKKPGEGKENFVETSVGKIKVLEYGFDKEGVLPMYIDLHGGGFMLMNARADEDMNLVIVNNSDIRVISIDYPLTPQYPYPNAVNAVYEVIAHYAKNAEEYRIDPMHFAIGGHSAGGNLAAVACLKAKMNKEKSFKFTAQVMDFPSLDLASDPYTKPLPAKAIKPKDALMYNVCYIRKHDAKEIYISPIFASVRQLEGLPNALVIAAEYDSLHDEAVHYAKKLSKAGVQTELCDIKGVEHGFVYYRCEEAPAVIKYIADFVKDNI